MKKLKAVLNVQKIKGLLSLLIGFSAFLIGPSCEKKNDKKVAPGINAKILNHRSTRDFIAAIVDEEEMSDSIAVSFDGNPLDSNKTLIVISGLKSESQFERVKVRIRQEFPRILDRSIRVRFLVAEPGVRGVREELVDFSPCED